MFTDILEYPWVLKPVEFKDKDQLQQLAKERIVAPAEENYRARQTLLKKLYRTGK